MQEIKNGIDRTHLNGLAFANKMFSAFRFPPLLFR